MLKSDWSPFYVIRNFIGGSGGYQIYKTKQISITTETVLHRTTHKRITENVGKTPDNNTKRFMLFALMKQPDEEYYKELISDNFIF